MGLLANQDPSGPISITACPKACSLAQQSASLRPLVTDFVENLQPETKSDGKNRSTKRTVYQISVDQATVIGLLLTIVILMVASFLFTQSGSQGINFTGLVLQFVLYAGALLLYGSGGRVDAEKLHEEANTEREE